MFIDSSSGHTAASGDVTVCRLQVPRAGGVAGVADGGPGAGVGGDADPGPGPLHRAAGRPDREDDEPHRQPGVRHQGEPAPGTIQHNLIALLERSKSRYFLYILN